MCVKVVGHEWKENPKVVIAKLETGNFPLTLVFLLLRYFHGILPISFILLQWEPQWKICRNARADM